MVNLPSRTAGTDGWPSDDLFSSVSIEVMDIVGFCE